MRAFHTALAVAVAASVMSVAAVGPAAAQRVSVDYNGNTRRLSMDAYNAPIASVVSTLFARAGGRYRMGDVTGNVTLSLRDVTLENALGQTLRTIGGRYELRQGVYYITSDRGDTDRPGPGGPRRDVRIYLQRLPEVARYLSERFDREVRAEGQSRVPISLVARDVTLDEALDQLERNSRIQERIYVVRRGRTIILTTENGPIEPVNWPPAFRRAVSISARNDLLRDVVRELERDGDVRIGIDRGVDRDIRVTYTARNEPLARVLQAIADRERLRVELLGTREAIFRDGRGAGGGDGRLEQCRSCRFEGIRSEWRFCPMCGQRQRN